MVLDEVGGVDVIPANVDRIGFFAVPYWMSLDYSGTCGLLTIAGETWIFHDLDDSPFFKSSLAVMS